MFAGKVSRLVSIVLLAATLAGCNAADRISNIGKAPDLAPIGTVPPSVLMPMPQPEQVVYQPNSLWRSGSRAFFRDQRAARVGDILTVLIDITDSAKVNNSTKRSRSNAENAGMDNLFGYESYLDKVFPNAVDNSNLADLESTSSSAGAGSVDRKEQVELTIAAVVTAWHGEGTSASRALRLGRLFSTAIGASFSPGIPDATVPRGPLHPRADSLLPSRDAPL